MKASVRKPYSPRSELIRGAAAMAVGAALAYGGTYLFALLRPASQPAAPEVVTAVPPLAVRTPLVVTNAPAPGEDPWWRGDAEFWQEQARLNSAVVAPQYRDLQLAWFERMAANAKQRALLGATGSEPLAVPAKEAQTTELHITETARR
ncbi:hypothetical protein DNK06_21965 [Pseudomonas daroniae]|uniref:Uncharacterized protein n=1 Tax=Phytopseudomonas daroniae TaxID=2487519 RepID=A0A4Q9QG86_9GAMM|nr:MULTISPECIES: hypothetical protein [Pseudomonas]TBU72403.1 hypothetical protein DNK06_21965 [Pseudomonas daroniae]TBU74257.1 hypothetical protein DNK31_24015 [Pseudomonas sp. FRB 228]